MTTPLRTQLCELALLWCRLTGRPPEDFNRQFFSQLAVINLFAGRFPGESVTELAEGLNMCVMGSLGMRFSANEIRQARMRLSQEEPGGIGAGG